MSNAEARLDTEVDGLNVSIAVTVAPLVDPIEVTTLADVEPVVAPGPGEPERIRAARHAAFRAHAAMDAALSWSPVRDER